MTQRLALLEFINPDNEKDFNIFISNLVKDLKALNEDIDPDRINIDAYAPEGVRAKLRRSANEESKALEALLQQRAPLKTVSPILVKLEKLYYILSQFKGEAATCVEVKAVLNLAKSIYPGFSEEDKEEAFQQAADTERKGIDFDQMIPQDPNLPLSEPSPSEKVRARATYLRRLGI